MHGGNESEENKIMKFETAFQLIRDKLMDAGQKESEEFSRLSAEASLNPDKCYLAQMNYHKDIADGYFNALNRITSLWNNGVFDFLPDEEFEE